MLDEETLMFYAGDRKIVLSEKQTKLLEIMINNKDRDVPITELQDKLFKHNKKPENNVRVAIARINKKLKGIINIYRRMFGYRISYIGGKNDR